jgi:hypothetical protein
VRAVRWTGVGWQTLWGKGEMHVLEQAKMVARGGR